MSLHKKQEQVSFINFSPKPVLTDLLLYSLSGCRYWRQNSLYLNIKDWLQVMKNLLKESPTESIKFLKSE